MSSSPDKSPAEAAGASTTSPPATASALPFPTVRKVIIEWLTPFNNVVATLKTLAGWTLVGSVGDFLQALAPVVLVLLCVSVVLLLACLVLQVRARSPSAKPGDQPPRTGVLTGNRLPSALLMLTLVCATFTVWGHNKPSGALATAVPSLRTLQDALLSLQSGVDRANQKLDAQAAENAAQRAAVAADPASLAVVTLTVSDARPDGVDLRATVFLDAKQLAPGQATFRVKVTGADGRSHVVDLSADLAAAGGGDAQLALTLPSTARQLTTCLAAPYPDATQPHAVLSSYTLDPAHGGSIAQKGPTTMVPAKESPCAA